MTLLFGPIGLLYTSLKGGVIMLLVSFGIIYFTISICLIITWPLCMIWAVNANKRSARHLKYKHKDLHS
jgi:hypothetical protein